MARLWRGSYTALGKHELKGGVLSKKASIPVVAAAMVVGLLMTGCGGGDSATLTKAEFTEQANGICEAARKALNKKLETSTDVIGFTIAAMETEIDKIGSLSPPSGDEQQIEKMLDDLQKSIDAVESNEDIATANAELAKAEKIAEDYGMAKKTCLIS